uniref:Uncharacterized protein n=1 Tax=Candidatus Kentrum sp. LFY TaxID=2126342 RepID=A0A450V3S8_9GAMM|nr:MAG: hypothetical protein BECKLFY1418A_GA0070994_10995 [Candidatus Kentron sp. LFY]
MGSGAARLGNPPQAWPFRYLLSRKKARRNRNRQPHHGEVRVSFGIADPDSGPMFSLLH